MCLRGFGRFFVWLMHLTVGIRSRRNRNGRRLGSRLLIVARIARIPATKSTVKTKGFVSWDICKLPLQGALTRFWEYKVILLL